MREPIACLGAGRMARGIAVVFAHAGHAVSLVDCKPRDAGAFNKLSDEALGEVRDVLTTLSGFGLFDRAALATLMARVSVVPEKDAQPTLSSAAVIFEAVPELPDLKRDVLARAAKTPDTGRRHSRLAQRLTVSVSAGER